MLPRYPENAIQYPKTTCFAHTGIEKLFQKRMHLVNVQSNVKNAL